MATKKSRKAKKAKKANGPASRATQRVTAKIMSKRANGKTNGKANGKVRKARTAKVRRGGGKALSDFSNEARLRVLKPRLITRSGCFKNNQTVASCLAAQKAKGFRGRRKFIRTQIAAGRVALK